MSGPSVRSEVATNREPAIPVQAPDTLDLLRERVRSLEAQIDALRAVGDSAQVRHAALDSILTHDRRRLAEELAALRQSLIPLIDSVAAFSSDAVRVELGQGIGSVRSEGMRGREALINQMDGVARTLNALESRFGLWEPEVRDSLAAAAGRIQLERRERQAADSQSRLLLGIMVGLLVGGIGVVWWSGRGRIAAMNERTEVAARRLLEEQLKPLERISRMLTKISDAGGGAEPDHDLALGVCNEVNRIEKNLADMDSSLRGHRQLTGCVRRVKENLRVHRYDITELLGRDYDDGDHVEAEDFVEDEQLAAGRAVISRINRPEVRYRGRIIQYASVKVSEGF